MVHEQVIVGWRRDLVFRSDELVFWLNAKCFGDCWGGTQQFCQVRISTSATSPWWRFGPKSQLKRNKGNPVCKWTSIIKIIRISFQSFKEREMEGSIKHINTLFCNLPNGCLHWRLFLMRLIQSQNGQQIGPNQAQKMSPWLLWVHFTTLFHTHGLLSC